MPSDTRSTLIRSGGRFLSVLLAGLIVHGSFLAAMPVVWCVGKHGHSALELCVVQACHVQAVASAANVVIADGNEQHAIARSSRVHDDCVDAKPVDAFNCRPEQRQYPVSLPQPTTVPLLLRQHKPLAHAALLRPRQRVFERTRNLAELRSVVLLI